MCKFVSAMKHLLLAPFLLGFISPVFAEFNPEIHKKCIKSQDYKGCTKYYSKEKDQDKNNKLFMAIEKINDLDQVDQFIKKRTIRALFKANILCKNKNKKNEKVNNELRNSYKESEKFFLKKGSKNILKETTTSKWDRGSIDLQNTLISEFKENCDGMLEIEPIELVNKVNFKSAKNQQIIEQPNCSLMLDKNEGMVGAYNAIGCFLCVEAYERNLESKPSILTSDESDPERSKYLIDQSLNLSKTKLSKKNPSREEISKEAANFYQIIVLKALSICPSLY